MIRCESQVDTTDSVDSLQDGVQQEVGEESGRQEVCEYQKPRLFIVGTAVELLQGGPRGAPQDFLNRFRAVD